MAAPLATADPPRIWVEFPNGDHDQLLLTAAEGEPEQAAVSEHPITAHRLKETPLFGDSDLELRAGDTIEIELRADGTFHFVRIVKRGEFRHFDWLLPQHFTDSHYFREYLSAVVEAHGMWEQVFGGLLLVHIPLTSDFDAEAELDRRITAAAGSPPPMPQ